MNPEGRPTWFDRLEAAMKPWNRGSGVVVAVSGGGDSVGLLRGLVALGGDFRLSVACLDHGTREGESTRDAAFVAELAARLDLPFDLGQWRSLRSGHFEADARRARYAWLLDVATRRGAGAVAVGHSADDQAETVLHRIIRGTGLGGLSGMASRRPLGAGVTLIRPILGATRGEIRNYLAGIGQNWREDAGNLDLGRTRARIRHDLLPKLVEDYNPNVAEALIRLARLAGEASKGANRRANRRLDRVALHRDESEIAFDRDGLRTIPPAARTEVIRLAWRRAGWSEAGMTLARWRRLGVLTGLGSSSRVEVGAGVEAVGTPDRWTLQRRSGPLVDVATGEPRALEVPGSLPWGDGQVVASMDDSTPMDERVDRDQINGPLVVRSARPGDRFEPLGLDGRSQPLNDFFRGRKIARADRPTVPIVLDAVGIIWVAGHRIGHRVRRTEATARTLGLRFDPAGREELALGSIGSDADRLGASR